MSWHERYGGELPADIDVVEMGGVEGSQATVEMRLDPYFYPDGEGGQRVRVTLPCGTTYWRDVSARWAQETIETLGRALNGSGELMVLVTTRDGVTAWRAVSRAFALRAIKDLARQLLLAEDGLGR